MFEERIQVGGLRDHRSLDAKLGKIDETTGDIVDNNYRDSWNFALWE
ncbi:hypothetical protein [Arachidicoccus terrestris]|nr:hypothetical protein [Arachidicoccus terrestris]UAY55077.1 hypothetical protein K9M52_16840 [Arachidicoccus terrestris]